MHGRIRADAGKPWMRFTAEQVSTFVPEPSRLFLMDATMLGLPVDVLHTFVGDAASMRVKVCSVVPMVDVSGPDLARAETVTLFNDLCILAPAALVDAPVTWQPIDDHRVRATYRRRGHSVTAELVFSECDELVDFVSDDRLAASADGRSFTPRRGSTPLHAYRQVGQRRVGAEGEARWHPPPPEAAFTYLELRLDDIRYNVGGPEAGGVRNRAARAAS